MARLPNVDQEMRKDCFEEMTYDCDHKEWYKLAREEWGERTFLKCAM